MPNRILTNADSFNSLNTWLHENLQNPFRANSENLPADDSSRGIYFWFMKPEGYHRLSALGLNITAINPKYTKVINREPYDLVYIGTAGAIRKESNTLFKRLNWHLSDKHTENSICHEVLSTLRQTVGAALSNDLILPNTMNLVNEFFNSHFYVFVLSYPRTLHNALDIDKDEKKLISEIKPLLNIKNNPNALNNAISNPTKALSLRRKAILKQTQTRLGCIKKMNNTEKTKSKYSRNLTNTPQNNNLNASNICIEFHIKKDESIQDIIKNIKGIPDQGCTIELFEKNNNEKKIYEKKTGTRKTNIIYKYFGNTDNNQPRWKVIQQEMLDKGIEEITVRVCSDGPNESNEVEPSNEKRGRGRPKKNEMKNTTPKVKNVKVPKTLNELKAELQKLKLSTNFKVVLTCAGNKHKNKKLEYNGNKIDFRWKLNLYNPFDNIPGLSKSWKQFLEEINKENANNVIEEIMYNNIVSAYKLYNPNKFGNPNPRIYVDLHNCLQNRFYIASAGWGIIKNEFKIPHYEITFSSYVNKKHPDKYRDPAQGFADDINHLLPDNEDIIFLGGKEYLTQLINLTQNLPNRKIVFFKDATVPAMLPNPNPNGGTFTPFHFPCSKQENRNWHYIAAQILIAIYCPQNNEANI